VTDVDRWLETPGARLRWRDSGGDSPALLLLHGWALDADLFELFVLAARHQLRLLRFDRRGYGRSSGEPALPTDVDDAIAVLDAAGIGRCAVLGMSQGARVAAAVARRAPDRVSHVVLDGAPALRGLADEEHEPELPLERLRRFAREDDTALRAELSTLPLLRLARPHAEAESLLRAQILRYPASDLRTTTAPPPPPGFPGGRAELAQPVLVLNGAHDSPARLRIGRRLAQVLPHARREVLPQAGHLAALDDPEGYARAVIAFVSGG